jgi:hypothetical protein
MKKIVLVFVVLLAAPAFADVNITAVVGECDVNTLVTVSFDARSEANRVRAFGLNIQCDNDANIVEVTPTMEGVCTELEQGYGIFPGTILIDGTGQVTYVGTPVGEYGDLVSDTLPGLDSNGVTIEMASLYAPVGPVSPNAPDPCGPILTFRVDKACNVTITANVSRAGPTGVVMEDPDEVVTVNLPPVLLVDVCATVLCYDLMADAAEWDIVGQPDCWCYPRQCLGDADGLPYGKSNYYVSIPDLTILKAAWNKQASALSGNEACADFDHLPYGKSNYRVSIPDLTILKANWNVGGGPAATCLPGSIDPENP